MRRAARPADAAAPERRRCTAGWRPARSVPAPGTSREVERIGLHDRRGGRAWSGANSATVSGSARASTGSTSTAVTLAALAEQAPASANPVRDRPRERCRRDRCRRLARSGGPCWRRSRSSVHAVGGRRDWSHRTRGQQHATSAGPRSRLASGGTPIVAASYLGEQAADGADVRREIAWSRVESTDGPWALRSGDGRD